MAQNPFPDLPYIGALKNNVHWETFSIGRFQISIKRIKNMDKLIDAISDDEFNQDERLPYWAEIWPSALGLSEYLVENEIVIKNKKILELGCGLGLAGITATFCGGEVLFTDYEPLALEFTQINFQRNFKRRATVQYMDWRKPLKDKSFDIILAADVLYEKRWLEPILNVIKECLKDSGIIFLAEPNRTIAKDFFKTIANMNWNHNSLLKKVSVGNKFKSVSIHRINRC